MAKSFFFLRKATAKTQQLIYVGLRMGTENLYVSTGIKILPKHYDFEKSKIKQVALPELSLPANILQKKDNATDIISFVNNFLYELGEFINANSNFEKERLKQEIESFLKGENKNEAEQLLEDLKKYVSELISEAKNKKEILLKDGLVEKIDLFLHPPTGKLR